MPIGGKTDEIIFVEYGELYKIYIPFFSDYEYHSFD